MLIEEINRHAHESGTVFLGIEKAVTRARNLRLPVSAWSLLFQSVSVIACYAGAALYVGVSHVVEANLCVITAHTVCFACTSRSSPRVALYDVNTT